MRYPLYLLLPQGPGLPPGIHAGGEEYFIRVNVPYPGQNALIQKNRFDRGPAPLHPLPKLLRPPLPPPSVRTQTVQPGPRGANG